MSKKFTLTDEQIDAIQTELVYALDRLSDELENSDIDEMDELQIRIAAVKELQKVFE